MAKKKGLSFTKKRRKKLNMHVVRELFSWIIGIIISAFLAYTAVYAIGMRVSTIGTSMVPTIMNTEEVLVNRLIYLVTKPKKGDVIVFLPNGNVNAHYYVKRIAAVPGERVQIIDGYLYINGSFVDGPYDKMEEAGIAENEIKLNEGEYFVLGDARNSGEDSRSGNIGLVKIETIGGKVWFHLGTPENRLGFIK